ncbi:MAG: hypothetical protein GY801_36280 [bacterium]|nr:hypothetical protein [bacterium]
MPLNKSVDAGYLLSVMKDAGNDLNLVILDACRNNPFKGFSKNLQHWSPLHSPHYH